MRFIVLASIFLWACTTINNEEKEHLVFRYNEHSNISSLDPVFAKTQNNMWAVNQIFNGLVTFNDSLKILPCIAKKWDISEDNLSYTFHLRTDVYFHKHALFGMDSTRVVNAADFVYSFDRLLSPKVASPGGWVLQNVKYYKAVSDSVFQIKLKTPFPPFLGLLSNMYCSVVPKEIVENTNDFGQKPIGTGPFKFKFWEQNLKLGLLKNNNYFEKDDIGDTLPYLEAVRITFLPDKQSEFLQFIQGRLDMLNAIDNSYKDELLNKQGELRTKYKDVLNLQISDYLNTEYLGIYMQTPHKALKHKIFREILNIGFDRQQMVSHLRNNLATPAYYGFIPKVMDITRQKITAYNPQRARELLRRYKQQTADNNPKIKISIDQSYADIGEFLQHEYTKIGIETTLDVITPYTLKQAKANGKLNVFRASWIADYPDAENYLSLFHSSNFTPMGPNYTHFSSFVFDKYYKESMAINNFDDRKTLYRKMDSLIMTELPVIPLYYDKVVRFYHKNIYGLKNNPVNLLNLKTVKKNKRGLKRHTL